MRRNGGKNKECGDIKVCLSSGDNRGGFRQVGVGLIEERIARSSIEPFVSPRVPYDATGSFQPHSDLMLMFKTAYLSVRFACNHEM
jgi:hypothetical protein